MDEIEMGPRFEARYDGTCAWCLEEFEAGDFIWADGRGRYLCDGCGAQKELRKGDRDASKHTHQFVYGDDDNGHDGWVCLTCGMEEVAGASAAELPTAEEFLGSESSPVVQLPTAEEFLEDLPVKLNVSGQPPARYEWRGQTNMGYLVKEPWTGQFRTYKNGKPKGLSRVTTFNKAASDSKAINDWGKRNVVLGAALRPDILQQARGKTHEADKDLLNSLVAELETVAGAKVSADQGTFLHEFTEQMDAGLKTWRDAPEEYQTSLKLYAETLEAAGLEPVPGLIERTTAISEFGGVVGTFDRVFLHRTSGQYVIGDVKTGKTMAYAIEETEVQEWIYAHGVNQNGVYDWNTDTWGPVWDAVGVPNSMPPLTQVSEDVGVIIHMPVQGPDAGTVNLVHADLQAGARHAQLCHSIRSRDKRKVRTFEPPAAPQETSEPLSNATPDAVWEEQFRLVQSKAEAAELYVRAREAGLPVEFLAVLIHIGKEALQDPEPPF